MLHKLQQQPFNSSSVNNRFYRQWEILRINISKAKRYALGWKLQPFFFQIKLNIIDLDNLYRIKEYFGGTGTIGFEQKYAKLTVRKLSELVYYVIDHFGAYTLLIKKYTYN